MLLEGIGIKKAYGIQELFEIEKLQIEEGDRIGLVGINGAGKSTLLEILLGRIKADAGQIRRFCEIAWIPQTGTLYKEPDENMRSRMKLKGSAVKSGGEKTRLAIAAALSENKKLLFADEPTTNLDIMGVESLENMLEGFKGAFVLISHDRQLLSKLCNSIWELEEGKFRIFPGSYGEWVQQKKREREFARFEYRQYQNQKHHLEKAMTETANKAGGMKKPPARMGSSEWLLYKDTASIQQGHVQNKVKAIEKRLSQLEVKEKPKEEEHLSMRLGISTPLRGKNAVNVRNLTVKFAHKTVLEQVSLEVPANKRTVVMGDNGAGKTTLLQRIVEESPEVTLAPAAKIGYFSQEHEILDKKKTALENVRESACLPVHLVRIIMANLNLTKEHIDKPADVLSGGERAKVMLAKLLASDINVLILDEPTNHIDMYTAQALEELLKQWEGTLILVTHDRRLAREVAQRILFVEKGNIRCFEGSFAEYEESQKRREKKPKEQELELQRTLLLMRMTELESKIKHPGKGQKTEKMMEELAVCQEEYRRLSV